MPNALFESIARFDKVAPRTDAAPASTPKVAEGLSISALVGVARRMTESTQTPQRAVDIVAQRLEEATGVKPSDARARAVADRLLTRHSPDDLYRLSNLQWSAIAASR